MARLAIVLCVPAVLVAGSGPAGASTARPVTTGAAVTVQHARECASTRRARATTVVVPVVVDMGGASDQAEVSCVSVPAGSNGAQVLSARASLLGVPAPRYALSGLLCAIDGYPATGCGQQNGTHYAYWAYFHGGSSWTYASEGPASWKVFAGDVEGWRFEPDGSATPADPPPRSASDASTLCPASVPPTTTTTTPSGTVPSTSPPTSAASGTSPSGGPGGPATSPSSATAPGPRPFVAGTGTGTGGSSAAKGASAHPSSGTTTSRPPPTTATTAGSSATARHASPIRLAVRRDPRPGGAPIGIIVAVALIAVLALGAVIRARRRTTEG